jgi:hypothetical protein
MIAYMSLLLYKIFLTNQNTVDIAGRVIEDMKPYNDLTWIELCISCNSPATYFTNKIIYFCQRSQHMNAFFS